MVAVKDQGPDSTVNGREIQFKVPLMVHTTRNNQRDDLMNPLLFLGQEVDY